MTNDENSDNAPDALVEENLYLNAETPLRVPPEIEEAVAEIERGRQERNQLTIGELLHCISEEHLGDRQATLYQLLTVAEVGKELFYAAIGHIDATEEFLEEARGQWGPLVDAALEECG